MTVQYAVVDENNNLYSGYTTKTYTHIGTAISNATRNDYSKKNIEAWVKYPTYHLPSKIRVIMINFKTMIMSEVKHPKIDEYNRNVDSFNRQVIKARGIR